MEAAFTSETVLPWTKCKVPFSTLRIPLAFSLTPARPVRWTTFVDPWDCCALAMETADPAIANTRAEKSDAHLTFMLLSSQMKLSQAHRMYANTSETSSVGGPFRQAATPSR